MKNLSLRSLLGLLVLLFLSSCSKKIYVVHYPTASPGAPLEKQEQPVAMAEPPQEPIHRKKFIIIDPGHGGDDFGTQSLAKPVYKEKHLNLSAAKILQTYLNQMGYRTVMTRKDDTFIPLDKRASFANSQHPDLFVSVHFNSAPSPQAEGIEVFYYRSEENKERTNASKALAKKILDRVIQSTEAKSRGVKHGNLAVIRETDMPAVLIEGGFLTNESEMQKIKDPAYLKRLAWGIAQGVQDYINKR